MWVFALAPVSYTHLDVYKRQVFGTVIAFFLALLLVFLRIQVIDRSDNDFVRFWKVVGSGFARTYLSLIHI